MPIATAAFLVSALVFAPLSSYVAGRRARSAVIWFALGAAIGPIAILLLLVAPPGRCPDCGARVRGWPKACATCGAPFGGAVGAQGAPQEARDDSAERPIVVRPISASVRSTSTAETPRPFFAPMPPPREDVPVAGPAPFMRDVSWEVPTASVASGGRAGRPRGRHREGMVGPDAYLLGSGIFLGGSAASATNVVRLSVGDRYGLARDGNELQILGPVTIDPERIVARLPLAGADIELAADRLVVQGGPSARGMVVAFAGLALSREIDVAAVLGGTGDRAEA